MFVSQPRCVFARLFVFCVLVNLFARLFACWCVRLRVCLFGWLIVRLFLCVFARVLVCLLE